MGDNAPKSLKDGRFKKGNEFWKARSRHGLKPIFADPEELEKACHEYFEWVDDNPLIEEKVFGTGLRMDVTKLRAMTIGGLCIFLGIGRRTWGDYKEREEYTETVLLVENIIYEQKFAGAAAGLFNHAIIARDLGLAEKTIIEGGSINKIEVEFVEPKAKD